MAEQVARVAQLEVRMQQMFNYLYYEIDNTETVQEQQKLVVAEFGLLDVQVPMPPSACLACRLVGLLALRGCCPPGLVALGVVSAPCCGACLLRCLVDGGGGVTHETRALGQVVAMNKMLESSLAPRPTDSASPEVGDMPSAAVEGLLQGAACRAFAPLAVHSTVHSAHVGVRMGWQAPS